MTSSRELAGRCLCGQITFTIKSAPVSWQICHCRECQRAQGSAFACNAPVAEADVCFVSGEHLLKHYESSPGKVRAFCAECGSPVFSQHQSLPGVLRMRIGLIDTLHRARIESQAYCVEAADWLEDLDQAPGFAQARPKD